MAWGRCALVPSSRKPAGGRCPAILGSSQRQPEAHGATRANSAHSQAPAVREGGCAAAQRAAALLYLTRVVASPSTPLPWTETSIDTPECLSLNTTTGTVALDLNSILLTLRAARERCKQLMVRRTSITVALTRQWDRVAAADWRRIPFLLRQLRRDARKKGPRVAYQKNKTQERSLTSCEPKTLCARKGDGSRRAPTAVSAPSTPTAVRAGQAREHADSTIALLTRDAFDSNVHITVVQSHSRLERAKARHRGEVVEQANDLAHSFDLPVH